MLNKLRMLLTLIQLVITVTVVIILMYMFKSKIRPLRRAWGKMQMFLLGVTLDIEGQIDNKANMIIMNHQSVLDIIVMEYLHELDLAWVAKKEIAEIPWFGRILTAPDMIIIERESKSSLVKLLKESKQKYQQGRPIAIFPEGTRTDGSKLRKFKAGAKLIAQKNDFLVQPIVIIGTRKLFDSQNLKQSSGIVKVKFLPSVQASKETSWYDDVQIQMSDVLQQELKKNQL